MGVLAVILLSLWALGIVANTVGIVQVAKNEDHPLHGMLQAGLNSHAPGAYVAILSVLTVFWPATLVYSLVKKRN